jgi:DNA replication protein DnaC
MTMTMTQDLEQLLHNLKLRAIAARFDELLAAAETAGTPIPIFFTQLLCAEWEACEKDTLRRRIRRVSFPEEWARVLPVQAADGRKERQIRTFAQLDFNPKAENIVFIGETGVGRTGLMIGLARKAVQNGYRALFIKAQDLFDKMYASLADRSTRRLLRALARIDRQSMSSDTSTSKTEQTNIFFKLME